MSAFAVPTAARSQAWPGMSTTFPHFIGGSVVASGPTFEIRRPSDGAVIGVVHEGREAAPVSYSSGSRRRGRGVGSRGDLVGAGDCGHRAGDAPVLG